MSLLQISPPSGLLYLTVTLFYVAGITSFIAFYLSLVIRKRPIANGILLLFFGLSVILFATQYSRLTIPWFPGFPISSASARPYFFLVALAALSIPVGFSIIESLSIAREELTKRLADSEVRRTRDRERFVLLKEELIAEREQFLTIILHEINTPLTLFRGYLDMLGETTSLEEVQSHTEALRRASGRFYIMKSLFDARIVRPDISPFDLCLAVNEAISGPYLFTATRVNRGQVAIQTTCRSPVIIESDKDKIRTIIFEVVRNGLKAVDPGGVVSVLVSPGDIEVDIIIRDNGVGIPESYRERIWDPGSQYFRDVTTRRNEGLGYGLHTARLVLARLGGRIVLSESEENRGSTFIITLPLRYDSG